MPKVIYTEIDIVDMVKRGALSLEINEDVMLTDLAYEKANRLGLKLVSNKPENPPAAPVRPYIAQQTTQKQMEATPGAEAPRPAADDLTQRIRSAVAARMGNQVDPALLDVIIQRVLASTGAK
ncbi:MAG: hypothetical protein JXB15_16210 [Anaerolineales bacterium]|nr:hypothetical protein [Anaerolineales bacterium]